jgi:hypothetical protein
MPLLPMASTPVWWPALTHLTVYGSAIGGVRPLGNIDPGVRRSGWCCCELVLDTGYREYHYADSILVLMVYGW